MQGINMSNRTIFHIDVNSAYLSWEATSRIQQGNALDIRTIPSAIGGDIDKRRGIILAKSIPAKKYNIKTGEPITDALKKCPNLYIAPPNHDLYMNCSRAMIDIFKAFSPKVQQYSIDECFVDYSNMEQHFGSPVQGANYIKDKIKKELGFTVNIGISSNKLLAKMASDFKKPDLVHTLFPEEIPNKMWHLPIEDLFMVGRATAPKLHKLGIYTIGDLAKSNPKVLYNHMKSHGILIWNYANGIDNSVVTTESDVAKGIGNSTTIPFDVEESKTAKLFLLSLCENVSMRLRQSNMMTSQVSISIKTNEFTYYSHQGKVNTPTDITNTIFDKSCKLFDEIWDKTPIRQLGVRVSTLKPNNAIQLNIFDTDKADKLRALDHTIDNIRNKYGKSSVIRASFLNSSVKPMSGGMPTSDYPVMSSLL